jgi:hypothetical protein
LAAERLAQAKKAADDARAEAAKAEAELAALTVETAIAQAELSTEAMRALSV